MKEAQRNKWEKTRTKGKKRFLIINGIVGWGISTALLFTLISSFFDHQYTIIFDKDFIMDLVTSLIIFPVGGLFWGLWVWSWMEKLYMKCE
ncbi:hypothetical protein PaeBR_15610 [Paenibacillus sp. BR2-3]|uniref:hypothetical protein n=1 Tax=Paenibacillus sp. BR2-3 TaxID=3048494 RepID=UPI0039772E81